VVAEAFIGINKIIVAKERERGTLSVYRMGFKPGDKREQLYLWKYRLDKDRQPRRVLQNTDPLDERYRKIGSVRQRRGEIVVAARTVGGKEYAEVFFLKNAPRGESIVYWTDTTEPMEVNRIPGTPEMEVDSTFAPGESKWVPR
jgi:hypothetical protein